MESTALLVWGMLFAIIGLGFFVYGRRQKAIVPLVTGITLFVFPYFIPNLYLLLIIGVILVAIPYFFRL